MAITHHKGDRPVHADMRAFIRENREIARVQAERWQGVDPSRLTQALDYLEQLLGDAPGEGEVVLQPSLVAVSPAPFTIRGCEPQLEVHIEIDQVCAQAVIERIIAAVKRYGGLRF